MALTQISTAGVKDDAVTAGKIPANAVGSSELASSAVTAVKIAAGNVDNTAIGNNQVSLNKLVQGTSSTDGKFLRANNGADPSFETVSIPAGTTINNNADNRVITGSGTANTLNGESNVTIDSNGAMTIAPSSAGVTQTLRSTGTTYGGAISLINTQSSDYRWDIAVGGGDNAFVSGRGLLIRSITDSKNVAAFQTDGNVLIHDGNLKVASGHGIDFSATANTSASGSSMSNELLDDYEEGSWTPTFVPASGSYTPLYYSGAYTRIGKVVTCIASLSINGHSSASGEVQIAGLPFSVQGLNSTWSGESGHGTGRWFYAGPNHYHFLVCDNSTDKIKVYKADGTFLNHTNMSTGYNQSQFSITVTYLTDA